MSLITARPATPEDLQPLIIRSDGSDPRFQLVCKFCTDLGSISAAHHSMTDPKALRRAAEKFVEQAWWIDGIPICPKCYKRKNT
jgi:hypothetical protein